MHTAFVFNAHQLIIFLYSSTRITQTRLLNSRMIVLTLLWLEG